MVVYRSFAPIAIALLAFAAGCAPGVRTGSVEGTVLVDEKPLGGFEVRFTSKADGSVAMGYAQEGGKFRVIRGRGSEEIPVGDYDVVVAPTDMVTGVPKPQGRFRPADTQSDNVTVTVQEGANDIQLNYKSVAGR